MRLDQFISKYFGLFLSEFCYKAWKIFDVEFIIQQVIMDLTSV